MLTPTDLLATDPSTTLATDPTNTFDTTSTPDDDDHYPMPPSPTAKPFIGVDLVVWTHVELG